MHLPPSIFQRALRLASVLLSLTPLPGLAAPAAPSILPLAEVQPGQRGVWRTATEGGEVREFPLEVVGVVEGFGGPGYPVIFCRALDDFSLTTGPVSGMSGSPVYIDDRLVGAYAYGFTWSKDQALIGVTPIEKMLPLLELENQPVRESNAPPVAEPLKDPSVADPPVDQPEPEPLREQMAGVADGGLMPLASAGISPRTLELFGDHLAAMGLRLGAMPLAGSGAGRAMDGDLGPGSPLAVLLAAGDIVIGGVGTVTYREGEQLLAFGHPMFKAGAVELPVGPAEVVEIVRRYQISFKLARLGDPIGTLWQDQSTGIRAELGPVPYMIPVTVRTSGVFDSEIAGRVAETREMTPPLLLAFLAEALLGADESTARSTLAAEMTATIEGIDEPLHLDYRGVGVGGAIEVLLHFGHALQRVYASRFAFPRVENIEVTFRLRPGRFVEDLLSVRLLDGRTVAGGEIEAVIVTQPDESEERRRTVRIPVPRGTGGESLSLLVQDAAARARFDGYGRPTLHTSFQDEVDEIRDLEGNGRIYLRLVRQRPGLRLEGRTLESVPPSVMRLYRDRPETAPEANFFESVVWETSLPVEGVFQGSSRLEIHVDPSAQVYR